MKNIMDMRGIVRVVKPFRNIVDRYKGIKKQLIFFFEVLPRLSGCP